MNNILMIRYWLWGPCTIAFMLATGFYFTLRTHGVQFWCVRYLWGKRNQPCAGISPWNAFCTSLGGTLGVGNLAGVATAITLGGVGAVFYMMLGAFFGMATKYAELVLSIRYQSHEKIPLGGPMVYLSQGAHCDVLAKVFAICCIFSVLFTGAAAQGSAMAEAVHGILPFPRWVLGLGFCAVLLPALYGGRRRIARISTHLVPVLAAIYVSTCLCILVRHANRLLPAVCLMMQDALSPIACGGGVSGLLTAHVVSDGFAKGMFSNEAGMGSAPIAHGSVRNAQPCAQGVLGAVEVFLDTCVVCLLTALVLLVTDAYHADVDGLQMTILAFSSIFGGYAQIFIGIIVVFLAITTVLGWSFYGIACLRWLQAKHILRVLYPCAVAGVTAVAVYLPLTPVLLLADIAAACMTFPNLVGLWLLRQEVIAETEQFLHKNRR